MHLALTWLLFSNFTCCQYSILFVLSFILLQDVITKIQIFRFGAAIKLIFAQTFGACLTEKNIKAVVQSKGMKINEIGD